MRKRIRVVAIAGISSLSLVLAACSSDAGSDGTSSSSGSSASSQGSGDNSDVKAAGDYNPLDRDQIKDGGELTLALAELSEQQNPFHANSTAYTWSTWNKMNPQVGLFDGDGTFHANPDYITDVKEETKDGKTVVTYTINPKAQYNDGTPIDWKTFEHTWKFNNGEDPALQVNSTDGYELIESVTKGTDDKQAVVTFKQPYPWWEGLFNFLLPTQVADAATFNDGFVNKLHPEWGAGPFTVDHVDFNSGEVSFKRNDKWWGEPAKLDKVTYRQMESQASLNAFKAGEVDALGISDKDSFAAAQSMGDQVELRAATLPANYLFELNAKAPNLTDEKVREAILTGIDRSQLAAIRFNGLDYSEELPGSLSLLSTQEGYHDNFGEVISYDKEKAEQLLDEAGWTKGGDGMREKDGQKLTVRYVTLGDSPMTQATATAIQAMLRGIGVDLQVEERPSSDFSQVTSERDFDLFALGFRMTDPFGMAYFGQMYASDSDFNLTGTGSPEFDKKIKELQKLQTKDEQIERGNELEKEAFQHYAFLPYANGADIQAVKPGLANLGAYSFAIVPVENIGWMK